MLSRDAVENGDVIAVYQEFLLGVVQAMHHAQGDLNRANMATLQHSSGSSCG
jgi:hypothetical protein